MIIVSGIALSRTQAQAPAGAELAAPATPD
jgi:hypothetical protein